MSAQVETKRGEHTAKSGLFLRDYPGRMAVYPLLAATCCIIFFGGDWKDFWVTVATGVITGLVEWACSTMGPMGAPRRGNGGRI